MQTSVKQIVEGIETVATTYFSDEIKYVSFQKYPDGSIQKDCIALAYFVDSYPSANNVSKVSIRFEFLDIVSKQDDRNVSRKEILSDTAGVASAFIDFLKQFDYYIDDNPTFSVTEAKGLDGITGTEVVATFNYQQGCVVSGDGYKLKALTVGQLIESTDPIVIPIADLIENNSGLDAYFKRVYSTDETLNLSLNEARTELTIQTDDLTVRFANISFTVSNGIVNSSANIVCTISDTVKSGIVHLRDKLWTGQRVSRFTYDEAWLFQNDFFENFIPTNPTHIAQLDLDSASPFTTLKDLNEFSNTDRFTDKLGGQDYTERYAIDHLTGLGWRLDLINYDELDSTVPNQAAIVNALDLFGYSDWAIAPMGVIESIMDNKEGDEGFNYAPFNINESNFVSSSTILTNTTQVFAVQPRLNNFGRYNFLLSPIDKVFTYRVHYK